MQNWKQQRFVVLTGLISDIAVMLTSIQYWTENQDKLDQWCRENKCKQEGMIVIFPDEKTLSIFCLEWS